MSLETRQSYLTHQAPNVGNEKWLTEVESKAEMREEWGG